MPSRKSSLASGVLRMFDARDQAHMQRAIELARQGLFTTTPNPRVGCVVVAADGRVLGEGWHVRARTCIEWPAATDECAQSCI